MRRIGIVSFVVVGIVSLVFPAVVSAGWVTDGQKTYVIDEKIGIDTDNPQFNLHLMLTGMRAPIATQETIGDHAGGSAILMRKARGSEFAPARIQDDDVIGGMFGQGWDGRGYQNSASMRMLSDGGYTNGYAPGKIVFQTKDATSGELANRLVVRHDGKVGVGTDNPQSTLAVNGKITATEVEVTMNGWPDYVFEQDYPLPSLDEVNSFVQANGHLPDVPSQQEMEGAELGLGEFSMLLLRKVEELTLYVVDLHEKNQELQAKLETLQGQVGAGR